jgi:hypothetical protein
VCLIYCICIETNHVSFLSFDFVQANTNSPDSSLDINFSRNIILKLIVIKCDSYNHTSLN